MNKKLLTSLALCGFAGASLQAALIFHDSFDGYTAGDLNGKAGSADTGSYTGSWDGDAGFGGPAINTGSSLSYSDGSDSLATSGGHVSALRTSSGNFWKSAAHPNANEATDPTGSSFYVSGLMSLGDSDQAYFGLVFGAKDMFGFGLNSSGNALIVEEQDSTNGHAGYDQTPTIRATSTGTFSTSNTLFFVAKITDNNPSFSNQDSIELFVNPTLSAEPGTATVSYQGGSSIWFPGDAAFLEDLVFSAELNGGASSTGTQWDEIRVGDTWADVTTAVPEPSSYALLAGFLALGWIMIRRRKA